MIILLLTLVVIEIFCAHLAFETIGEITSVMYYLAVTINIIPLVLILIKKHKWFAMNIMLILGVIIIPYQFYLVNISLQLKEEAANITAYAYEKKIESNIFPENLSEYEFTFPNLQEHFRYAGKDDKFDLSYYVATKNTSHFYIFITKKWGYYPD